MPPVVTKSASRVAAALRAGGLAAIPTETVYGLAADARNPAAVAAIYRIKNRPRDHPVIVHLLDFESVSQWADAPAAAQALARAFWPGPLTLALPRKGAAAARQCAAGLATICLRAPAHPLARAVLARCGGALAAPSANRFGGVSPTGAAHVAADFADIEELLILDGGACANGIESTIVDLSGDSPALLRPGAITVARIEKTLGRTLAQGCAPAPGDRKKHYAPRAKIVVVAAADIESARRPRGWQRRRFQPRPAARARALAANADDGRGLRKNLVSNFARARCGRKRRHRRRRAAVGRGLARLARSLGAGARLKISRYLRGGEKKSA